MDASQMQQLAKSNGLGRIGVGAALVIAPGLAGRSWIGDGEMTEGAKVFARALGIRDVALGFGLVRALDSGPARGWLEGAAAADLVDAAATLLAWKSLPKVGRVGILALATSSAVQCAFLARSIDS